MAIVANIFNIVECDISFDSNGIQLNTEEFDDQEGDPNPTSISERTRPATEGSQGRADLDLSTIVFLPQKIGISRSRKTLLIFHSPGAKWVFGPRGLLPVYPLPSAIGTLADAKIIHSGRTVWTTFDPNSGATPTTQIQYNLELITSVSTNGVFSGHVKIIIDPIIETSKA